MKVLQFGLFCLINRFHTFTLYFENIFVAKGLHWAFALCLGRPGFDSRQSQTKDLKFVVEAPLSNTQHKKGKKIGLTCCQNNVTGWDIIQLWCDISVRQHYKMVIIPSVKSKHHLDMTWNVLKGTLNPIQKRNKRTPLYFSYLKENIEENLFIDTLKSIRLPEESVLD